jgi:TonB-dependent outer membrane receptor, SusC/RagA subfamily, signature region
MNKYPIEGKTPVDNFKHALKIMRITLFFLFFGSLFSQAAYSYSQGTEFTFHLKSASIKEICEEIEKKSDFRFIFAGNAKKIINKRVNLTANAQDIEEILNNILASTELKYRILDNQVVIFRDDIKIIPKEIEKIVSERIIQQQKKQITGTIIDKQGEPIIGANVIEKGTSNGTITDIDGNFTLNVENNAVLHISYIGYLSQDINTTGRTSFDIALEEDTKTLEEVVVIGYGTQRKATLTGAVSSIKGDALMVTKNENVQNMLTGKVPGVRVWQRSAEPGAFDTNFDIRGFSTSGTATPLIVIDGVTRTMAEFQRLSPNDIEDISVLKDGTAAIYGVRAANGVIVVSTKKREICRQDRSKLYRFVFFSVSFGFAQNGRHI